ncbi:MAG: enoyl-CoA hydratase-related protein [Vagococcus sp.]|jgi:enoyl-CoA hydratase
MTNYENVLLSIEEGIATLTINRPKNLNALNQQTLEEIEAAVYEIKGNKEVKVLVVTGAGEKAFVAGADIKEMASKNALEAREFSIIGNRAFKAVDDLEIPVIAAINGYALGGGLELAMACDIRFASTKAVAGLPEVNLGVIPGFGGTQRLSRIVGVSKALELLYAAVNVKAEEGQRIGLFNQVFEPEALMEETMKYAKKITTKGPIAINFAKQAVKVGYEMPLDKALGLESELFGLVFSTEDQTEGMTAFVEKRSAEFKNQ